MIFYFSGTGNSLYIAKRIADHLNEPLVSISAAINTGKEHLEYRLAENERVGFIFPTHAWGPPGMVLEFIRKLKLTPDRGSYIYAVATCGGNIANTMKVMEASLKNKAWALQGCFSVKMPNNYILMGDVDSEKREKEKLAAAEKALQNICPAIEQRKAGQFDLARGLLSGLLTGYVNPMFSKKAMDTSKFYANDRCSGCGTCEKVCNSHTIQVDGKPHWGERCTMCLACIHYCPSQAIQYGKGTEKKGRYTHPRIDILEISNR